MFSPFRSFKQYVLLGKEVGPMVGVPVGKAVVGRPVGAAEGRGEVVGRMEIVGATVGANSPYTSSHKRQGSKKSATGSEA